MKDKNVVVNKTQLTAMMDDLKGMVADIIDETLANMLKESPTGEDDGLAKRKKPSSSGKRDSNIITGFIAAVTRDGSAFRIGDSWYEVNSHTRLETDISKGKKVRLYYFAGEIKNFANAVYKPNEPSADSAAA